MILPTKIVKPVDSLFSISAFVLQVLKEDEKEIDYLLIELNKIYYKEINYIEKLILCLVFLYIIDLIELKDSKMGNNIQEEIKLKENNYNSLKVVNIDIQQIQSLYNEANFFFGKKVIKRLEDAQRFHNLLVSNRKKRITIELKELRSKK